MSNLVEFAFEGRAVRVELDERGEPLFNANDVCAVLGFSNPWKAIADHVDEEDLTKREVLTDGGAQQANFLTESGLYAIILGCKLPAAKKFKRWVISEVLPHIRKTGSYTIPQLFTDDRRASQALIAYNEAALLFGLSRNAALIAADNAVARRYAISFKDELGITLQAEDNEVPLLVSSIAEILGIAGGVVKRGKVVNDALVALGFQTKLSNGDWLPLEAGAPYAFVSQTGKKHKDGTPVTQVKWKHSVVEIVRRALSL